MGGNDPKVEPRAEELAWIFETTVLSAFALANRLDVVCELYSGRAMWTLVVHDELMRGVKEEPLLGHAVAADWLGEPQPVFETARVENLRQRLGGRPSDDRHHGEATCLALAERTGAGVLTDTEMQSILLKRWKSQLARRSRSLQSLFGKARSLLTKPVNWLLI